MAFRYIKHTALVATLLRFTAAQQPNVVPEDLRSTFSKGTEVQVSYTNEANNGFRDGTLFEKDGNTYFTLLQCPRLTSNQPSPKSPHLRSATRPAFQPAPYTP
jgi:hypothetical protein